MGDEEKESTEVKYLKTKYELLYEDYGKTKRRAESLENRILELSEEYDRKECEHNEEVRQLKEKLMIANRRVEQLEATCFLYKNQCGSTIGNEAMSIKDEENANIVDREFVKTVKEGKEQRDEQLVKLPQIATAIKTTNNGSAPSSPDGITRSSEFRAGDHLICEYHKLPVLAQGEGFIYGFRWNTFSKIHIV